MSEFVAKSPPVTVSPPFPRPPRTLRGFLAPAAIVLALLSALVTFLVLTGLTPIIPTHEVVVSVLLANTTMVVVLLAIVAWGFFDLIRARRKGRAVGVEQTYVREHALGIRADLAAMADDLSRLRGMYDENHPRFREILSAQASIRGLPVTMMIHGDSSVVERADIDPSREAQVPTNLSVKQATMQRPIAYFSDDADFVAAVMPLAAFD